MTPTVVLAIAAGLWTAYEALLWAIDRLRVRRLHLTNDQLADRGVEYR